MTALLAYSSIIPQPQMQPAVRSAPSPWPRARLISAYSTRNLGDAAILRAIANMLPGPAADIAVLDDQPLTIPGVRPGQNPGSADLRVSVGGDIFNNYRPNLVTRNFLSKLAELRADPDRTIVFGQTIPSSCRGLGLTLLAQTLQRLPAVVVRDEASFNLLRSKGVQARLSWDAAFTTRFGAAAGIRAAAVYDAAGIRPEKTALVSVRPFDHMYPVNAAAFERRIQTLCKALADRGHDVGLLIQAGVNAWDEDRPTAERIAASDRRFHIIDCLSQADDPDPVATLTALLGMAHIAVGVRYHTTVLRLAAGRQPYNYYYSRKGEDLNKRLGLSGSHVDGEQDSGFIRAIEATADATFDNGPLVRDVEGTFADALREILP